MRSPVRNTSHKKKFESHPLQGNDACLGSGWALVEDNDVQEKTDKTFCYLETPQTIKCQSWYPCGLCSQQTARTSMIIKIEPSRWLHI